MSNAAAKQQDVIVRHTYLFSYVDLVTDTAVEKTVHLSPKALRELVWEINGHPGFLLLQKGSNLEVVCENLHGNDDVVIFRGGCWTYQGYALVARS